MKQELLEFTSWKEYKRSWLWHNTNGADMKLMLDTEDNIDSEHDYSHESISRHDFYDENGEDIDARSPLFEETEDTDNEYDTLLNCNY